MKITKGHMHGMVLYESISYKHFVCLFVSLLYSKIKGSKSLTFHLPLEIQHPKVYRNQKLAERFIGFGESLKKYFEINLYWENAPLLNFGKWDLKYGQTDWENVPRNIELCLDTGHLILGSKDITEARKKIRDVIKKRGTQIKHLHLHENDLVHDSHRHTSEILTKSIKKVLTDGRTYIYEN